MARGTLSASLRRIGTPTELARRYEGEESIADQIASYKLQRSIEIEGAELILTTNFPDVAVHPRQNYAETGSYSEISGMFARDFPLEVNTREGPRTIIAVSRSSFSFRPETGLAIYFGASSGADDFACALADALLSDWNRFTPVLLSSDDLKKIRERARNIRYVGYRNNPDPNVRNMSYGGTHVEQSSDVKRADRNAELHRIIIEILTSAGKRTLQIMGSGGILGYGTDPEQIEDVVDIIEGIAFSSD
ncbi:MAG: hypothetical protein V3U51_00360 [Thermoplasmata archaeon]